MTTPRAPLVALTLALALAPHGVPARGAKKIPAKPDDAPPADSRAVGNEILDRLHALPADASMNQRLLAVSDPLLGMPYALDPLGEQGRGLDPDPLYRFEQFDCETLIETMLAMSKAEDLPSFALRMVETRYPSGHLRYEARSHLIEAQWLPSNTARGFFTDITREIGGPVTAKASISVRAKGLEKAYEKFVARVGAHWPVGEYSIPYVPIDWAIAHADEFPEGTIIQIVREPRRGVPHAVTHQGVVLRREDGKLIFRNASSSPRFQKVVDRSVRGYLEFSKAYFSKKGRWEVVGVNLLRINEF